MYIPDENRYQKMEYQRCGLSGLELPKVSLGLWHNFGDITPFHVQQSLLRTAFDGGITHFDLANNYGPPYGEAERNFGEHMRRDWHTHRDELIISTKAGYDMWPGPYGDGGSRKYLMASLNQSLKRMNVDYVDIFYHHRPDPETPLEETMGALRDIVRSGKALYVGVSNYGPELTRRAAAMLKEMGVPLTIHQPKYNLLTRDAEDALFPALKEEGIGCIVFSPLRNGVLTGKYLNGVPEDSRLAKDPRYLKPAYLTEEVQQTVAALNKIAREREESLTQMSLSYVLRHEAVTSVLIGASRPEQIVENCRVLSSAPFTEEQLAKIDRITGK